MRAEWLVSLFANPGEETVCGVLEIWVHAATGNAGSDNIIAAIAEWRIQRHLRFSIPAFLSFSNFFRIVDF